MSDIVMRHPSGAHIRLRENGEIEFTNGDPNLSAALWAPLKKAPDHVRFIYCEPIDCSQDLRR